MEPSIKGAMIAKLIEDAQYRLQQSGERRPHIEAKLSAETLALLENDEFAIGRWYPITQYTELTEMLWREEGGGRIEYLHERGAAVMQRLIEAGLYQQLDYLERVADGSSRELTRERILSNVRLVGSVMGAVLSFGKREWRFDPENPDHLLFEISEAAAFPEVLRFVYECAITYLLHLAVPDVPPVTSERVAPDRIVLTLDFAGAVFSEP